MKRWLSSTFGILELILGGFLLLFGFWIASPWWSTYNATPAFRTLSVISPAWLTGMLPMLSALLLLFAKYKKWRKLRNGVLFFLVGYFLFCSILFFVSSPASTAWIVYTTMAMLFAHPLFFNWESSQ